MASKKKAQQTATESSEQVVIDEAGNTATLSGFGWAKDYHLDLDSRIDLTQPIWEQVQQLARTDEREASKILPGSDAMAEVQFNEDGIEIPSEVIYQDDYAIIRYADGTEYKMYGYGSMRDKPLDLDPRIDLTKPIYEQAMKLWREDEEVERKKSGEAA